MPSSASNTVRTSSTISHPIILILSVFYTIPYHTIPIIALPHFFFLAVHSNGIIHRDIKPSNLVWSTVREFVKIVDFGVAHFIAATAPDTDPSEKALSFLAGSPPFMAPEICSPVPIVCRTSSSSAAAAAGTSASASGSASTDNTDNDNNGDPDVTYIHPDRETHTCPKYIDIWALGVTLYCFLFAKLPFWVPDPPDVDEDSGGGGGGGMVPMMRMGATEKQQMLFRIIGTEEWRCPERMGSDGIRTGGRLRGGVGGGGGRESGPPGPGRKQSEGEMVVRLLERCLDKNYKTRITLQGIKVSYSSLFFFCQNKVANKSCRNHPGSYPNSQTPNPGYRRPNRTTSASRRRKPTGPSEGSSSPGAGS
jgi:serine/threonine protein kinase